MNEIDDVCKMFYCDVFLLLRCAYVLTIIPAVVLYKFKVLFLIFSTVLNFMYDCHKEPPVLLMGMIGCGGF